MASPTVNVGTGTTMVFGTVFSGTPSTSVYEVTGLSWGGASRPEIETTHMGTTASPATFGGRTWMPGDVVNAGQLTVEGHFNPDLTPPIEAAAGELTIAWAGAGSWVATAICTSFELTVPMEEAMGFTATFQISAGVEITAG